MCVQAGRAKHLWFLAAAALSVLFVPSAEAQNPEIRGQIARSSGPCEQVTAATVQCIMFPDELMQVNVRSEAGAGTLITLRATGLPEGASFPEAQQVGEVVSVFLWAPSPAQIGIHEVHFIAETDSGSTQINLNIDVVAITPTPTPSDSPTVTPTETVTPTATESPTHTPTATPIHTSTGTPSPSPTTTPTRTPPASATVTPLELTPTSTITATVSPTHTGTETSTATGTPTHTPTPRPVVVGDCNGNGTVSVEELVLGSAIALGHVPTAECTPFDSNQDGAVAIDELLQGIGNAIGVKSAFAG